LPAAESSAVGAKYSCHLFIVEVEQPAKKRNAADEVNQVANHGLITLITNWQKVFRNDRIRPSMQIHGNNWLEFSLPN
jgi:hypothetical protein